MSQLELVGVSKLYGSAIAVDNISIKFDDKGYICLLGPSGCGKTSTLRMVAGHEDVSSGSVLLDGRDISRLPPAQRGTAMMFQNYALFPHMTVEKNVAFSLKIKGVSGAEQKEKVYKMTAMDNWTEFSETMNDFANKGTMDEVDAEYVKRQIAKRQIAMNGSDNMRGS